MRALFAAALMAAFSLPVSAAVVGQTARFSQTAACLEAEDAVAILQAQANSFPAAMTVLSALRASQDCVIIARHQTIQGKITDVVHHEPVIYWPDGSAGSAIVIELTEDGKSVYILYGGALKDVKPLDVAL